MLFKRVSGQERKVVEIERLEKKLERARRKIDVREMVHEPRFGLITLLRVVRVTYLSTVLNEQKKELREMLKGSGA